MRTPFNRLCAKGKVFIGYSHAAGPLSADTGADATQTARLSWLRSLAFL